MQLNTLSPSAGSTKTGKRVGRGIGSGSGKTCGRGHNGQKSRSGGTIRPGFEGGQMPLHMRLPKFGFSSRVGRITAEVRTAELNKVDAEIIDVAALRKANLITAGIKRVKVMLSGDVTRAVTLKDMGVTKGARAAIEAAGGKILEVDEQIVTLSVGSADGVRKDMVFIIHRDEQYVGDVKISEVTPNRSAGFLTLSRVKPQANDRVTDKISMELAGG